MTEDMTDAEYIAFVTELQDHWFNNQASEWEKKMVELGKMIINSATSEKKPTE